ncbi:MAG TPA: DUF3551 domain-containing protein [Pseudolabrys sp.]|nr:DUF3551 domain-containing protein [Pseudolabrys sp.]
MIRTISAAAVGAAVLAFAPPPAQAYEAPWCAVINMGHDVHWDCQYRSFDQCYPTIVAGNRGFCNPNPAYSGSEYTPSRRRIRHY